MKTVINAQQILDVVSQGGLVFVNHSGGKDSQAQMILLAALIPVENHSQIVAIHADLGRVEWEGIKEHIQSTLPTAVEFCVIKPVDKNGAEKDLLTSVELRHIHLEAKRATDGKRRAPWPSPSQRWCTSDFKRGPLQKLMRRVMEERGAKLAVSCMGLRADESDRRECGLDKKSFKEDGKVVTWRKNEDMSKAGRTVYDSIPIHSLTLSEVWEVIADAGQKPHHVYASGMSRLSCCFCIMSKKSDLQVAAKLKPELYAEYVALEKKTGYTMQNKSLEETTGIKAS